MSNVFVQDGYLRVQNWWEGSWSVVGWTDDGKVDKATFKAAKKCRFNQEKRLWMARKWMVVNNAT